MPELPTPPAAFVKRLKAINRHFSVKFVPGKGWAIMEGVRQSRFRGFHGGAAVYTIGRRPVRGIYVPELGHEALQLVRRQDPRRFSSMADLIKGLKIDG